MQSKKYIAYIPELLLIGDFARFRESQPINHSHENYIGDRSVQCDFLGLK